MITKFEVGKRYRYLMTGQEFTVVSTLGGYLASDGNGVEWDCREGACHAFDCIDDAPDGSRHLRAHLAATKDTNPKDAVGARKAYFSTLPMNVIAEVGTLAMLEGAVKYGRHNYRVAGVRASVYFDALHRHMSDWWEGEDIDPASGASHVTKAIACLVVLRDSMLRGNWTDDRPPRSPAGWLETLNKQTADILDKYPDPKPAHTEKK